jgi:rhomboid-like protein
MLRLWTRIGPSVVRSFHAQRSTRHNIWKPIAFAGATVVTSFGIAGFAYEERRTKWVRRARQWMRMEHPDLFDLIQAEQTALLERMHQQMTRFRTESRLPEPLDRIVSTISYKWHATDPNQRLLLTLVSLNALVFGAWQIPRLVPFMCRHFLHDPSASRAYTMLTACFSHREIWHLSFNMMALWSFGQSVLQWMSREEFTAFYLSSGVLASLGSHLLRPYSAVASLGASGAIFGLFSASAWQHPEAQVHLVFLPTTAIQIGHGLIGLMALDLIGAIRGWQMFDHVAHLSGALTGLAYMQSGRELIWANLQRTLRQWRHRKDWV